MPFDPLLTATLSQLYVSFTPRYRDTERRRTKRGMRALGRNMESVGHWVRQNASQQHFGDGLGKGWKTSGRGQQSGGSTPRSISLAAAQVDP